MSKTRGRFPAPLFFVERSSILRSALQFHPESTAAVGFRINTKSSPHSLRRFADESQPDACSFEAGFRVDALKNVEESRQVFGRNPNTVVLNGKADAIIGCTFGVDANNCRNALARKFQGV